MKLANTLFATVAMVALAGPAFAQVANPTLLTTTTFTQAPVTTSISPACTITANLAPFVMSINPNGAVTTAAPTQTTTVICNTVDANITVGSNDMVNSLAPAIIASEVPNFTNTIKFIGQADGGFDGQVWKLDSRASTGTASQATIGYGRNNRIRPLVVSIEAIAPADGKLPVAGAYTGAICITIEPSGALGGTSLLNNNVNCT